MATRFKKRTSLLLVLAALLSLLSACGGSGEPEEPPLPSDAGTQADEVTYYKADNVFSLNCDSGYSFNPYTTKNVQNLLCAQLMYDRLFTMDDTFAFTPELITDYSTDDGIHWKFSVDTSVTFWDGSKLTASDASYSLQRATRSPQYAERFKCVYGVNALDENMFIVTLNYADMLFPALLDIPLVKNGSIEEAVPLGTGPYQPDENRTKLTAFSGHRLYASLPTDTIYLKEVTETEAFITAFENSEIDLVANDPSSAFNLGYGSANEVRYFPTTNMQYLGFNSKSRFFSNPLCRKAMTYVIDREHIVMDILDGAAAAATLPVNPVSPLYNDAFSDIVSYSVSKSEAAFNEAQVQDYDDDDKREIMITGIPVEIDLDFLVCSESPAKVQAAQSIADKLTALGITVELKKLSWDDYAAALAAGEFDLFYAETRLTNDFSLRNLLLSGGALNYGKISDAVLEQHITDVMAAGDNERKKTADLMFKYITDTAPIVPVCFEKQQVITHRGVVTGMRPVRDNIFYGIENWEINTD